MASSLCGGGGGGGVSPAILRASCLKIPTPRGVLLVRMLVQENFSHEEVLSSPTGGLSRALSTSGTCLNFGKVATC